MSIEPAAVAPAPIETPLDLLLWAMGERHSPDRLEDWDERKYNSWFWWQAELRRRFAAIEQARGEERTGGTYGGAMPNGTGSLVDDLTLYHGMMLDRSAEYCEWVNRKVPFGTVIERAIASLSAPSLEDVRDATKWCWYPTCNCSSGSAERCRKPHVPQSVRDARDAARYRWFCAQPYPDDIADDATKWPNFKDALDERIDAAIDAARTKP